ncbi:MAG: GGDEF domain-containing protein [Firmicutes bacterium]|nr:GGDEF domain-containing protein [Bacillota bacterium]
MKDSYEKILEKSIQHDKLYEIIRVVDPVTKEVLFYKDNEWNLTNEPCYVFWGYDAPCPNCTSMRAINTNKNTFKIQYQLDKSYTVISAPTTIDGRWVSIELLSDATNSIDMVDETISEMKKIIEKTNELTIRDGLTKIYNRKFIDEQLPFQLTQAQNRKNPSFVVMGDIDYFKRVNDTYGHQIGDEVLKKVAELLSKECTLEGWAARYGGEEFILFLSNYSLEDAIEKITHIKNQIQETVFNFEKYSFSITASFGLAQIVVGDTPSTIIEKADSLLYLAKNSGRNTVKY